MVGKNKDKRVKCDAIALLLKHGNNDQKLEALSQLNEILSSAPKNDESNKDDGLKSARNVLRTMNNQITYCLNNGNLEMKEKAIAVCCYMAMIIKNLMHYVA